MGQTEPSTKKLNDSNRMSSNVPQHFNGAGNKFDVIIIIEIIWRHFKRHVEATS